MAKHDKRVKYHSEADKPVMLSLRVPRELNERLERYASEHQRQVSELVRDGIEMRLEVEADPRTRLLKSPADAPLMQIDGASLLRDVRRMVQQEFEAFCESRTALIKRIDQAQHVTDTATATPAHAESVVSAANGTEDTSYPVIHSHTDVEPVESQRPTLDHAKFYLGELCPRGHEWNGTGKTLKRKQGNRCMACENARKRERRGEQRASSA